jgi:hypothetical protein
MIRRILTLAAAVATVAVTSLAVTSSAEARAYHRFYRGFGAYAAAPWYAPRYGFGRHYRYFDRLGSNLNPDRQMVGLGE